MASFRGFIALALPGQVILTDKINELLRGKLNTVAEITLATNQDSTTVTDELVSPDSAITLTPLTANAGAETWHISSQGSGTYTVMHNNSGQTDRTFRVNVIG